MCGELPNEGLNASTLQLTNFGLNYALNYSANGLIDNIENLKDAPVVQLVSDKDPVTTHEMMEANKDLLTKLGAKVKSMNKKTGHFWPVDKPNENRPKCETQQQQNDNCNYDFSGDLL